MSTLGTGDAIPRRSRLRFATAAALLVVGAMLLTVSGAYYAYKAWARSGVDDLNVELARPAVLPNTPINATSDVKPTSPDTESEVLQSSDDSAIDVGTSDIAAPELTAVQESITTPDQDSAGEERDPPGNAVQVAVEAAPPRAPSGNADLGGGAAISPETLDRLDDDGPTPVLADGSVAASAPWVQASSAEAALYTPVPMDGLEPAAMMPATRIRIPALDLDSRVAELGVVRSEDSASWETPKHVVGHIPTTANAGSGGQGWYFGHLESPIRGEGSVFRRLPEVAQLLKDDPDRPVYVFLESGDRSFAYRIYNVEVVSQEGLEIADSGTQDITLVTCTPRFVYDQRLLVTAALVGVLES